MNKRRITQRSRNNGITDYHGSNQGFDPGDIETTAKIESLEEARILQCITEESFKPKIFDRDHEYFCGSCGMYLKSIPNGRGYVCDNARCSNCFVHITHDMLLTSKSGAMGLPSALSPDSEENIYFASWNPDNQEFNGDLGREIVYESADSRIKHIKYSHFPKSLSLEDNS